MKYSLYSEIEFLETIIELYKKENLTIYGQFIDASSLEKDFFTKVTERIKELKGE
jgi:hypothetical protein